MSQKIGIIGFGFVGSAVAFGFSPNTGCDAQVKIYDKDPNRSQHSLEDLLNNSDFIFLSVPTPANRDGSINLDILDKALSEINDVRINDSIILIRSTIIPGSSQAFANKYPELKIVFNPEFITERNANEDFINQERIIIGGHKELTLKVAELYRWRFGDKIPIIETDFQTAELIKYMNNCFFATKVSFMNEMKMIADKANVDWQKAVEGFTLDSRVGNSHVDIPGYDGKLGFGGSCFPKDIQALIQFSKKLNLNSNVLGAAWKTNLEVRPEKDWEKLKGRAIIEND